LNWKIDYSLNLILKKAMVTSPFFIMVSALFVEEVKTNFCTPKTGRKTES